MATRLWAVAAIAALVATTTSSQAAKVQTANFIIDAPTQELALEFGKLAEHYRKQKAMDWLGQEMPQWSSPCPLRITVTMNAAKGATSFNFPNGQVYQTMFIEGPLDRLRHSVLPHEITHTVLAHYFRRPVPRWADEGGSVYSEDELERNRHDQMCRQILNAGRGMPLRRLFSLRDYPDDVMVLYAEGYAVSKYLIEASDRPTFLKFVADGMQWGWDHAAQSYYQYKNVNEMEQAWLDSLRKPRESGIARAVNSTLDAKLVVRQSAPPAQPILDPLPVSRGVPPTGGRDSVQFGEPANLRQPAARLGEPIPFGSGPPLNPPSSTTSVAAPPRVRPLPPPVVLFPPEPLPLRY